MARNEKNRLFSLNEVVREAIYRYQLKIDKYDYEMDVVPEIYRKKILAFADNIRYEKGGPSIKEIAHNRHPKDHEDKRSQYFFTYNDKEAILTAPEARKYFIDHTTLDSIKNTFKYKDYLDEQLEQVHQKYEDYQKKDGIPLDEPYIGDYPRHIDELEELINIKLTALFELFFDPINYDLLSEDMENSYRYGGNTETLTTLESKLRHKNPHNYYTLRQVPSKELDFVLDILADRMADRITDKILKKIGKNLKADNTIFNKDKNKSGSTQ